MYITLTFSFKPNIKASVQSYIQNRINNSATATKAILAPIQKTHNANANLHFHLSQGFNANASFYIDSNSGNIIVFGNAMKDSYVYSNRLLDILTDKESKALLKITDIAVSYADEEIRAKHRSGLFCLPDTQTISTSAILIVLSGLLLFLGSDWIIGVSGSLAASVIQLLSSSMFGKRGIIINNPEGATK